MSGGKEETVITTDTVIFSSEPEPVIGQRTQYAWVVLLASFLTQFLNPSLNYASGVFHVALLERFNTDITLTAWVGALYGSMFALAGPVASLVTNMFDCRACVFASGVLGLVGYGVSAFVTDLRVLFLTYALLAGEMLFLCNPTCIMGTVWTLFNAWLLFIFSKLKTQDGIKLACFGGINYFMMSFGQAFAQVASVVVLGYYFPHHTALTSGIVFSGTALGIFVHPPLVQALIDWYGLTGAFLLCGAIVSHCCILGLLMRPSQDEKARKAKIRSGRTPNEAFIIILFGGSVGNKNLFLKSSFATFLISTLFFAMGYSVHVLFLPDYMMQVHSASSYEASLVISFIGIGSLISRVCIGALGNDNRVGPEITYFSIVGITAVISAFISVFAQGTGGRLAYGLLLGLYTGGVFTLQSAIVFRITGVEHFPFAFGAVMFFLGLGALIGAPMAGSIYQNTGNYKYVFISSSVMFFASSLCGFLSAFRRTKRDSSSVALDFAPENCKGDTI